MSDVYGMLEAMEREGLSGPLPMDGSLRLDEQALDKFVDDSEDPRWSRLLRQYFVESEDASHDDMLFFVRAGSDEQDAVFVLRKQAPPSILPPISEVVMWKETFLLNLIVQMPCKLTVAVCKRRSKQGIGSSSGGGHQQRGGMSVVRKHVSKRVYALPSKSRMDRPKDNACPPECSWPYIYYVIDDYEDMFEDMFIKKGEYLCVELSARIPVPGPPDEPSLPPPQPHTGASFGCEKPVSYASQDGNVFSSMRSRLTSANSATATTKVVLFQGAASFSALIDNYVHRLSSKNMLHRLRKPAYTPEFIMMRGPGGKGHAQVAITGRSSADELADHASRTASVVASPVLQPQQPQQQQLQPPLSLYPKLPVIASPHLLPISAVNSTPASPSLSAWLKRISLPSIAENLSQATSPPPPPKSLQASMTFVSIPWNSIIEDLLNFKRQLE
ncbi:hypothetical protein GGI04_001104 [Coemansia thaxteri]|uniref:Uncharacterized protein n=1 Tax=Coemansia thaxteri TaxID=2663907 RepID=A0A9W8ELC9_9FUNG|nr:hypothetical protein H4R26_000495 [Coemansia thaxteri]KAJ2008493.1 hypothetical protein GGI04_001104 [Coemansia thaxteri]KAJ2470665.1 hypothetical protein GGI02_002782 [Coemansia sp. RSA 2322]KAJ2487271.1 hypothetical protein EV174_000608 [Coemansia sp. RSA 2320]